MIQTVKGKTQKEFLENKLIQLLYLYGTSGKEERVQKYLIRELSELKTDFVKMDEYGNIHTQMTVGDGKGAVLHLNSHMDTVSGVVEDKRIVNDNGVYTAHLPNGDRTVLGADDRAGIATILTIMNFLPNFNGTLKVSFYREEEIGCVGSSNSDKTFLSDVDLSITFDRHGSKDIVVGTMGQPFSCNEVGNWLEIIASTNGFEYKAIEGGISDAMTVSEEGINAVNLSVGYYNEHTKNEFLVFSELYTTLEFAKVAIEDLNRVYYTFTPVPKENQWIEAWSYKSYGYGYDSYSDYTNSGFVSNGSGSSYGIIPNQALFAPVAYIEDDSIAIISDGAYEMDMTIEEVDDLINQLTAVRNTIEANTMLRDYNASELPF